MPKLTDEQVAAIEASIRPETQLEAAIRWTKAGWAVHPLKPSKDPLLSHGSLEATTDEAQIRKWWERWPSAGIGGVMGDDKITFDIDYQHGGRRLVAFPETRTHYSGRDADADGNRNCHLIYRYEPGSLASQLKSRANLLGAGVDCRRGRGAYIVLPPSLHEESGEPYTVGEENGGRLHVLTDDEVRAICNEAGVAVPGESRTRQSVPVAAGDSRLTGSGKETLADLFADPPSEGGRNDWLTRVAGHYIAQNRKKPKVYQQLIHEANEQHCQPPLDPAEVDKIIESITDADDENHPDGEPSKAPSAAEQAFVYAKSNYDFYVADGQVFAVAKSGPRLMMTLGERGAGPLKALLQSDLYDATGKMIGAKSVEDALGMLVAQALTKAPRVKAHIRCAEIPGGVVIDLAQPGSGRCIVVTGEGWTIQDNPPEGIFFRRTVAVKPLPDPSRQGSLEPLRKLLGWEIDDPRWLLAEGWMVASVRASIARPLLLILGGSGTAKTARGKMIVSVLDPREDLGGSFGKQQDDDNAKAMSQYFVGWDNVSRVSEATSDWICRLVTGMESISRLLYTNADAHLTQLRRTGVISSINVPYGLKPDAMQRLIPLECDPIRRDERGFESKIRDQFEEAHPVLLGGLMDAVVVMFRNLPERMATTKGGIRMLDFQVTVAAFKPEVGELLERRVEEAMVTVAESDPFISTVVEWLNEQKGELPEMLAADVWEQAGEKRHRVSAEDRRTWWPGAPQSFTRMLLEQAEPLRASGYEYTRRRTKGGIRLQFTRTGETSQSTLPGVDGVDRGGQS